MIVLVWLDLAKISIAGGLLGFAVGKLVMSRPYYLERLRPRFWLPIAKEMRGQDWLRLLVIALAFATSSFFIVGWLGHAMDKMGWTLYSEEDVFARLERISPIGLFVTVNILPIFEEWVFRGILLEEVARRSRSRLAGVFLSALIFGAFHISNPGTYPAAAMPLAAGGILLGACYLMSGLSGAIICHCAYNSLLVMLGF